MTAKPKRECEELKQLRYEAKAAGLRARRTERFSQFGAAELVPSKSKTVALCHPEDAANLQSAGGHPPRIRRLIPHIFCQLETLRKA